MPRPRIQARAAAAPKVAPLPATPAPVAIDDDAVFAQPVRQSSDHRDPVRPDMRPQMRDEDPRLRAAKRAAELRSHGSLDEGEVDKFYIAPDAIPDGWGYEWKTQTVLGKEDPSYQVNLARQGWEPVPASRHPEMMPKGSSATSIERDGMVLYERPKEIIEEARERELRKARMQVRVKEDQLNAAPKGQFDRQKSDGTNLAKVSKHYEPMPIPEG